MPSRATFLAASKVSNGRGGGSARTLAARTKNRKTKAKGDLSISTSGRGSPTLCAPHAAHKPDSSFKPLSFTLGWRRFVFQILTYLGCRHTDRRDCLPPLL